MLALVGCAIPDNLTESIATVLIAVLSWWVGAKTAKRRYRATDDER
jgi:hypothetical protein